MFTQSKVVAISGIFLSFILFIGTPNAFGQGRIYHVSPADDLQTVINMAQRGDQIVLTSGDHVIRYPNDQTGKGLIIDQKNEITIRGQGLRNTRIITDQGWVKILVLKHSGNMTIRDLSMSHELEGGYCFGSVVEMDDVRNIWFENVGFEGSGTQAASLSDAYNVTILGGRAVANTEGVFEIDRSDTITIDGVSIYQNNNTGHYQKGILDVSNSRNISFLRNQVADNRNAYFKRIENSSNMIIESNTFANNTFGSQQWFVHYCPGVNVREQPTRSSYRLTSLPCGAAVEVLGQTPSIENPRYWWYQVTTTERVTGWVYSGGKEAWLRATPLLGVVVTEHGDLYIRKGPGRHYEIIGQARRGAKLIVKDGSSEWFLVQLHDGLIGYAYSSYIARNR